jgi:hypothetical protein
MGGFNHRCFGGRRTQDLVQQILLFQTVGVPPGFHEGDGSFRAGGSTEVDRQKSALS